MKQKMLKIANQIFKENIIAKKVYADLLQTNNAINVEDALYSKIAIKFSSIIKGFYNKGEKNGLTFTPFVEKKGANKFEIHPITIDNKVYKYAFSDEVSLQYMYLKALYWQSLNRSKGLKGLLTDFTKIATSKEEEIKKRYPDQAKKIDDVLLTEEERNKAQEEMYNKHLNNLIDTYATIINNYIEQFDFISESRIDQQSMYINIKTHLDNTLLSFNINPNNYKQQYEQFINKLKDEQFFDTSVESLGFPSAMDYSKIKQQMSEQSNYIIAYSNYRDRYSNNVYANILMDSVNNATQFQENISNLQEIKNKYGADVQLNLDDKKTYKDIALQLQPNISNDSLKVKNNIKDFDYNIYKDGLDVDKTNEQFKTLISDIMNTKARDSKEYMESLLNQLDSFYQDKIDETKLNMSQSKARREVKEIVEQTIKLCKSRLKYFLEQKLYSDQNRQQIKATFESFINFVNSKTPMQKKTIINALNTMISKDAKQISNAVLSNGKTVRTFIEQLIETIYELEDNMVKFVNFDHEIQAGLMQLFDLYKNAVNVNNND